MSIKIRYAVKFHAINLIKKSTFLCYINTSYINTSYKNRSLIEKNIEQTMLFQSSTAAAS